MRGARSTATWTSPSSIAAVMRWIATLVGPKAVHIEFASRPSRPAQSCGLAEERGCRRAVVGARGGDGAGEEQRPVDRQQRVVGAAADMRFQHVRGRLHQLHAGLESAGRVQRVRDRAEERPEDDRIVGLLRGVETALGGDPGEVGLAELGQHGHRRLVGQREQRVCALRFRIVGRRDGRAKASASTSGARPVT